jgi:hypothetical protein
LLLTSDTWKADLRSEAVKRWEGEASARATCASRGSSAPRNLIDTLYRGIENIDFPSVQDVTILSLLAWIRHVPNG